MFYLASSVTMPLSLAALLLVLCVGEAIALFYLLGSKKNASNEETASGNAASAETEAVKDSADEEDLAVILSVLCEELNARPEELVFKDIKVVTP